ncbi:transcription factor SPT20 homolog [Dioscorea cayenensis subsp. rotundata]|uniref:Transcription factor SPT20 homolog n=1 Tax=Dioscorea cayennensis subsp. rotundata TaxID=55577 RepID=A0AB40BID0_DIOCR|nr:transcription factor SPT20 homolog [Dioscorea cayenensis subsp. rotundata]
MNQNEQKIETQMQEDSICPCTSSVTENNSEKCSKPQKSQSFEVTSSNTTKQDQNQQKDRLASLDDASLQAKVENSERKFIERQQQQQQEKKRRKLLIEDDDVEDNDHKSMNQNEQRIETQMQEDSICPCTSSVTENNSEKCSKPQKSQSCEVTSSNTTKQDQNQQKDCLASLDDVSLQAKLESSKRKFIERQQEQVF